MTNINIDANDPITPFLKWAGGKRWLASDIIAQVPETFGTYIEPFLGGGAVFFSLRPRKAILSDVNAQLINAYIGIRDHSSLVTRELKKHHRRHGKNYYYELRSKKLRTPHTQAAQFIYLNRTCWNGLYRVNLNGAFNVPIGTKTNVVLDSDDFEETATQLRSATIQCQDFELTIDLASRGDVVFADPPYTIHHNHNGFVKYNERIFSWEDQIRLRDALRRAASRGAKIISTNANHESVHSLYREDFFLSSVSRLSVISGVAAARRKFDELFIVSK